MTTANTVSRAALTQALNSAYADYFVPIVLTPHSLNDLIRRESIQLAHSALALAADQPVGMGLLGIRAERGWIGGMGVIPEYRGQGIGRRLMQFLLHQARICGLQHVQLEVITRNQTAYNLYDSLDFSTDRQLHVLSVETADKLPAVPLPASLEIRELDAEAGLLALQSMPAPQLPWQREPAVVHMLASSVAGFSLHDVQTGQSQAACLYVLHSNGLDLLRVEARDDDLRRLLVAQLLARSPSAFITYLNVPEEDPVLPILHDAGFTITISQYEMSLPIPAEEAAS